MNRAMIESNVQVTGKRPAHVEWNSPHSLICDSSKGCKRQRVNSTNNSQGLSHVNHVNMEATRSPCKPNGNFEFLDPPTLPFVEYPRSYL